MAHRFPALVLAAVLVAAWPFEAQAQTPRERLCDSALEDCRAPLLSLIQSEQQGIDIGYWYMADARYSTEIIKRFQAGVPVRLLMDDRAGDSKPTNGLTLQQFIDSGIPMRKKNGGGILHWKMMLFHGQNVVEFSKANFSSEEFVANQPGVDWTDEAVYFTSDDALTNTFRTKFDDLWTNTTAYANYANVTGPLVRRYGTFPLASSMNIPPGQDFATRSVSRYNAETSGIDVLVFRATDNRHADAMMAAVKRGVAVRLITDPQQYRDPTKLEHPMNIDRMYMAGVQIKSRNHQGLMHEALVVLHGLGEVIFGSSNWSPQSGDYQLEHNFFYTPSLNKVLDDGTPFYQWFANQFERKWNDGSGFVPFQPLPPTSPQYAAPANGAAGLPFSATLRWEGGNWAWKYDIYFGTSPNPPLSASDVVVGSPDAGVGESYTVQGLDAGTTYYWRIVGKTMADQVNSGPLWAFTTAAAGGTPSEVVLYAGKTTVKAGSWEVVSDASAAGGVRIHQPDAGVPKLASPATSPANYFELSFDAVAGVPYHLWFRGMADRDSYANDSVWVQFTNTIDSTGTPSWRIGSTSGIWMGIEECSGCGVQGWGWHDNGYGPGVRGAPVYFSTSGVQTIRVQQREDGISIDQIVLSPGIYLTQSPGSGKNDTVILAESGGATGGTPPPGVDEIVIHAKSIATIAGNWIPTADNSAADGVRLWNPNAGAGKLGAASATPASYIEATFEADAGKPYHLWLRMKAEGDSWTNDSVFVQFSGSQSGTGAPIWRIGTSDAASVSLEEGNGAGEQAWGWNDNAYGSLGAPVYFSGGTQTIRIQVREDGVSIDQIVLSAVKYLNTSPGTFKNDTRILAETGSGGGGGLPPPGITEIVLHATAATTAGNWTPTADNSAADGVRLWNPNAGAAKVQTASATPANFFEATFTADAGKPYHLWLRMKAEDDSWTNDSVFVQFSGSQSGTGAPIWRIGTSDAAPVSLEEGNGAGEQAWGWNDNAYGSLGAPVYFAGGTQTIRIQVREDGVSIDQIVLSAAKYLNTSPGTLENDSTILPATTP